MGSASCDIASGLVTDRETWARVLDALPAVFAFDFETTNTQAFGHGRGHIVGAGVGTEHGWWYCPVRHMRLSAEGEVLPDERNVADGVAMLAPLLACPDKVKVAHNAAFDMRFALAESGLTPRRVVCTQVLGGLCWPERLANPGKTGGLSLDALAEGLLGVGKGPAMDALAAWCREHAATALNLNPQKASGFRRALTKWKALIYCAPLELVAPYVGEDVTLPLRILALAARGGMQAAVKNALDLDLALLPVITEMEARPKYVDMVEAETRRSRLVEWGEAAAELVGTFTDPLGRPVNPRSSQHMVSVLFSRAGAFLPVVERTKSGKPGCAEVSLLVHEASHPIITPTLAARRSSKFAGTFLKPLLSSGGRVFAEFPVGRAATGRLSSRSPNLQNLPRGDSVRGLFVAPDEDHVLLFCDYAQVEPRLMAHFSADPKMCRAFNTGEDIYGVFATSGMFPELVGVAPGDVKRLHLRLRTVAKTAVLAVFYGAQAGQLQRILLTQAGVRMSLADATALVLRVHRAFPSVAKLSRTLAATARDGGRIVLPDGRSRPVGRGFCKPRDALNTLIQGTAAVVMKRAMLEADRVLRGSKSGMVLSVHDEVVVQLHRDDTALIQPIVESMRGVMRLRVPLVVEADWGHDWGNKRPVPTEDGKCVLSW